MIFLLFFHSGIDLFLTEEQDSLPENLSIIVKFKMITQTLLLNWSNSITESSPLCVGGMPKRLSQVEVRAYAYNYAQDWEE